MKQQTVKLKYLWNIYFTFTLLYFAFFCSKCPPPAETHSFRRLRKSLIACGKSSKICCSAVFRLHRIHEMQIIVIDVRGSVTQTTRLHCVKTPEQIKTLFGVNTPGAHGTLYQTGLLMHPQWKRLDIILNFGTPRISGTADARNLKFFVHIQGTWGS